MASPRSHSKPVMLALQGGGTHAAFAWGALDQLLLDGGIEFEAISATSGGALNAVALAQGWMDGGAEGARKSLETFWRKVSVSASMLPLHTNVVDKFLSNVGLDFSTSSLALDTITRIFSPYQFNLFDLNPLRAIVEEMVDFKALQRSKNIKLFINATHVKSAKSRIFTTEEITLDVVMAACCLPFIFKTVEIDGAPYWDGAYTGCPSLLPLLEEGKSRDLLLLQTTPMASDDVPVKAPDILDRATEISFASSLLHELKFLEWHNTQVEKGHSKERPIHLHLIESQELLASLGRASKLNADWDFLVYAHDLGVQAASDWLEAHSDKLGKKASMSLKALVA